MKFLLAAPMTDGKVLAQLEPEVFRQFCRGVEEFNNGMFFECHETLEDVWHGIRGSARDFFQGLIQIAVGFYHLDNANLVGSRSQLEKGLRRLEKYHDAFMGIDLGELRRQAAEWLERLHSGQPIGGHVRDLPKIRFTSRPER